MTKRLLAGLVLALLALGACGPDNGLSGSLGAVFPMDISGVDLERNDEALQITYTFNRGVFVDIVARVSVLVRGLDVKPGLKIALDGTDDAGVLRCTVDHAPGGEAVRVLPEIKRGDLTITQGGQVGQLTRGSFSMLFEDTGGDIGFGRTLGGTFLGTASDAGFGPLP
jgi:hypothetical protein